MYSIGCRFCREVYWLGVAFPGRRILNSDEFKMRYGQVVLGPPGSGKSTYCSVLQKYYTASDRQCIVVNLDPANDNITCSMI